MRSLKVHHSQTRAMVRCSHAASIVVCQMFLAAFDLSAQGTNATVRGTVTTDSGRRALEGVEILMEGQRVVARSAAGGRYVFQTPDTGAVVLLVRHPGYSPVRDSIRLSRSVELERNFELVAVPTTLAGVEVRERGGVGNVALRDFERRRKGTGKFLVQADIEKSGAQSLESLVRSHIGGFTLFRIRNRGIALVGRRGNELTLSPATRPSMDDTPDRCFAQIFVNGQRVYAYQSPPTAPPTLDEFDVTKILAVEFYRGPSETPTEFSGPSATCGTMAIWTHVPPSPGQ